MPSYDPGSEGFFLLLHELGHTIGLKHPHDDGGTGRPTLGNIGLGEFDKDWFSIMSYQDDYPLDQINFDPATPMLLDVIGLQALYGKNMSTNAGNNTHVLDTSNLYYTIWDAGGVDIMDMSSANEGWYVVLPDTLALVFVGEKIGFGLPLAEIDLVSPSSFVWLEGDIEHATGSNFSDIIVGNSLANVLDGGAGADTAVFGGNYHEYSLATFYGTTYITGGADGADSLTGIETLDFFDWIVSPPENRSPLEYVAGYGDLIAAIGSNPDAALGHYLGYGRYEGRDVAFDALEYVASHGDLVRALGANRDVGAAHYINYGYYEGRTADAFNAAQYLTNYADLQAAFGNDLEAATMHYIEYGFEEGRTDDVLMV